MRLSLRIPFLKGKALPERRCRQCGVEKASIHGRGFRRIKDLKLGVIESLRMRCKACGKTFTVLPEGQSLRRRRSDRAIACGILLYCLGLSYLKVVSFLEATGVKEAVGTVYGDCMRAGQEARRLNRTSVKGVRILGVDGTGQRVKGQGSDGVVMAVDLERDLMLEVELISEDNPEELKAFIRDMVLRYGVEITVSDEHKGYNGLEEAVGREVKHYHCRAHFLRAKLRRLRELKSHMEHQHWWKKLRLLNKLEGLIRTGPVKEEELKEFYRQFLHYKSPGVGKRYGLGYKAKLLLQELLEKVDKIGTWTNNTTERLIGLCLKLRSKTMRGFKKKENIKTLTHLLAWIWHNRKDCNLALVV